MTRQASAVHVAGKFENEMFTRLRWNPRVSIIKNPALTSLVSNKEMARQMLTLYQKVLDSNVYTLMSQQAATTMTYLLQAATCPEIAQMPTAMKQAKEDVEKIDATDWRNICIYAHDEHISDIIAQGTAIINPELTMIEVDNAQRFAPSNKYSDKDLRRYCYRRTTDGARTMHDGAKHKARTCSQQVAFAPYCKPCHTPQPRGIRRGCFGNNARRNQRHAVYGKARSSHGNHHKINRRLHAYKTNI